MKEWIYAKESDTLLKPVQELVRCKDCKHYNSETHGCKRNPSVEGWLREDFCSYGERIESEE